MLKEEGVSTQSVKCWENIIELSLASQRTRHLKSEMHLINGTQSGWFEFMFFEINNASSGKVNIKFVVGKRKFHYYGSKLPLCAEKFRQDSED